MNPISSFTLRTFVVGYIETNMYVLAKERNGIIIDPGFMKSEATALLKKIKRDCDTISAVFLTHCHFDHISGLRIIKEKFNATIYGHKLEGDKLKDAQKSGALLFEEDAPQFPFINIYLNDGDVIELLGLHFSILHTPGHTAGGISIHVDNMLFSGDTLFKAGVGRADFYDSSYDDEISSIKNKILTLPPETVIYPGHGPPTTVKAEQRYFR